MRFALAIPLVLLAACNVTKDGNSVTVQYDQNTAQNTAADIGNTAQNIGADIANDVQKTGDKIENKVGSTNISVKVGNNEQANSSDKTEKKSK